MSNVYVLMQDHVPVAVALDQVVALKWVQQIPTRRKAISVKKIVRIDETPKYTTDGDEQLG